MIRTTVMLTEEQRAALLALAARRGERGFSIVIQEAVDLYLRQRVRDTDAPTRFVDLRGSLAGRAGDGLGMRVRRARGSWDQ